MVDFIITDFNSVRGGGNIVDSVPSTGDFIVDGCTVSSSSEGVFVLTPSNVPVPVISLAVSSASVSYGTSVTLTATVTLSGSAVSGETVTFKDGSTSLGTASTNSSGIATKSYASTGSGDVSFTAECSSIVSETYTIEDCLFYGIDTTAFNIPSNTTFTSDGSKITATTSTTGEKIVYYNHSFSNSDNWLFETEVAQLGTTQSIAMVWNDNTFYGGEHTDYANNVYSYMQSSTRKSHTVAVGDKFRVTRESGVTSVYINNEEIDSKTISHKTSFKVGYFINRNRTQYYKNIKIKSL